MFSRITLISALLLLGAACASDEPEEEGSAVLTNLDDEGKGDTVFGKTLRYAVRASWPWWGDETELHTDATVLTQTDTMVRVLAMRVIFDAFPDKLMELAVDAESFNDFGEISTDMAFLLFTRRVNEGWRLVRCAGVYSYFESVIIDAQNRELDVVARTSAGDRVRTYSWAGCGIPEDVYQYSLFPFPSSGWWSLEGYYSLRVQAACDGNLCPRSTRPYWW